MAVVEQGEAELGEAEWTGFDSHAASSLIHKIHAYHCFSAVSYTNEL